MNSKTVRTLVLLTGLLLVAAPALAQANFGKYVALGDSLTAGFLSGGLISGAQERSYPALLARQAGISDFQLPLASNPGIPALLAVTGFQGASPVIVPRSAANGVPLNLTLPRPYDNLAVPGYTTADALNVVSDPTNPLSDLVLRGLGTEVEQAIALQPTFVTVWLGNNDVLGAAVSGIVIDGVTLTPAAQFAQDYNTILGALAQFTGAQMALANLPDVTALPFVNTLPPVVVNPATGSPVIGPNGQPIPLIGPNGPLGPNDKVLLSASGALAQGLGIPPALGGTGPLPDQFFLSAAEVGAIRTRTAELNGIIAQAASDFGAALIDIHGFFNDVVANGYPAGGGIELTTDFLSGGIFSYDGVHPMPVAYAVVANLFIDAINSTFNDDIPRVSLIPFLFGPDGTAGGTIQAPGVVQGASMGAAAVESLRNALGIPSTEELLRVKDGGPGDGPTVLIPQAPEKPTGGLFVSVSGR